MSTDSATTTPLNARPAGLSTEGDFLLRLRGGAIRLVGPAMVLALWYVATTSGVLDQRFVPSPVTVAKSLYEWMFATPDGQPYTGTWFTHAYNSTCRVLIGFAIASVLGVVLGTLIGWFKICAALLDPIVQILRPIPITSWVPFAVIFFGIRDPSAYFLIALGAFFPIVVNTASGVSRVPKILVRAALMLGSRPHKLLVRVVIPAALPYIFTGLRIGIGLSWVLVIVAEMLAVKSGLGFSMWDAYYFLRMDIIIAAMLSVGVLGFLSDLAVSGCSRRLLRWSRGL